MQRQMNCLEKKKSLHLGISVAQLKVLKPGRGVHTTGVAPVFLGIETTKQMHLLKTT